MNEKPLQPGDHVECEIDGEHFTGKVLNVSGVLVVWEDENECIRESYRNHVNYVPTLAEIAAAAALIRKSWTATDRKKRSMWRPKRVTFDPVPYVEFLP